MPPIPQHIVHAVKVYLSSPTGSRQGEQALRLVADYCVKNKLVIWRLLDKARALKAVAEVVKDAGLAQTAITTAGEGIAGETGALTGEVVAEAALEETAVVVAGVSPVAVAAVVILLLIVVAMVIYTQYENAQLDQMGRQQDHQRQVEKGLRSAVPGASYKIDPGWYRSGNAGA